MSYHVNINPQQNNHDSASGAQGAVDAPGTDTRADRPNDGNKFHPSTASQKAPERPLSPTPDDFIDQADDWWKPGRILQLWAKGDQELHNKKFILLDTKNREGTGVLVETLPQNRVRQVGRSSDAYFTHMELHNHSSGLECTTDIVNVSDGTQKKHLKVAHVDKHGDIEVDPNTYILMDHTYNIPFFKYKAADYGMLRGSSLKILRLHYVALRFNNWQMWDLVDAFKAEYVG